MKDNHTAVGSITEAVRQVRAADSQQHAIEVEVKNLVDALRQSNGHQSLA